MEHVMLVADGVGILVVLWTLIILIQNIRDFWGTPTAEAFVYYGAASFLLGLISLFIHLSLEHVIRVDEAARTLAWHIMFYLSMGLFVAGTVALLRLERTTAPRHFSPVLWRGLIVALAGVTSFVVAIFADAWATRVFGGSIADRSGAVHFLAFAMCIGVVRVLRQLEAALGSYLSSIARPIRTAVLLFGVVHAWELLSESWKFVTLPGEWGEAIELALIAVACAFVLTAFLRTRRRVR